MLAHQLLSHSHTHTHSFTRTHSHALTFTIYSTQCFEHCPPLSHSLISPPLTRTLPHHSTTHSLTHSLTHHHGTKQSHLSPLLWLGSHHSLRDLAVRGAGRRLPHLHGAVRLLARDRRVPVVQAHAKSIHHTTLLLWYVCMYTH
mgnify:CR=1 FL=1